MAKSRVKGIVIEIGGDTVGLNKALDGTTTKLNSTQAKLKDVERLLKLDPKNTVLLEQKHKLLAEAVQETKGKLDTLNEANDQLKSSVRNYDDWKAAYDPIQEEIDTTTKKLKELRDRQAEMKDCGEIDTDAYQKLTEEIQDTSRELRELKARAEEVNEQFGNPVSPEQFDALQREIQATKIDLRNLGTEADKNLERLSDSLDDATDDVDQLGKAFDGAKEKASTFGDVFTATAIVEGAKGIAETLRDTTEETKEYRKIMGSLEVSSEAAGYSADQTKEAYKRLYGVLGDDQSAATTVANLQALGLSQGQMLNLIDNVVGGWARYGDSIPIDGLAEAINETAKAGKVTGTFADILNWGAQEGETYGQELKDLTRLQEVYDAAVKDGQTIADYQIRQFQELLGVGDVWDKTVDEMAESEEKQIAKLEALIEVGKDWNKGIADATTAEDRFNIALEQCSTEAERIDLIMQTMASQGLSAVGEKWRENNASMIESNETAADMQEQMAQLGETIEPLMTRLTAILIDCLEWFNGLDAETQNFIITTVLLVASLGPVIAGLAGVGKVIEMLSGTSLPNMFSVFGKLNGTVLPGVQGAFSSVFGFIAANPVVLLIAAITGLVAWVATSGDEMQAKLQEFDDFLQQGFARDWTEVFGPVLGGALNEFFDFLKGIWDSVKQVLDGIIDFIRGVFTGDWERAWKGVVSVFEGIFSGLATILKAPINAVIDMVNGAIDGINWLIDGANKIPGVEIPRIEASLPYLANGGEVLQGSAIVGEAGPELLTVLPGRTIVQPLSNQTTTNTTHMGGITVNVYGAPGQDEEELADRVAERLQQQIDSEEAGL